MTKHDERAKKRKADATGRETEVRGWTWEFIGPRGTWILCYWFSPTRRELLCGSKPSREARPVKVRMTVDFSAERSKREGR